MPSNKLVQVVIYSQDGNGGVQQIEEPTSDASNYSFQFLEAKFAEHAIKI